MEKYLEKLKNALEKKEVVIMLANCRVDYDGRAKSYLESGDRIIIIKPDRTLLIHQPTGSNPINYMKAQTEHSVIAKDDLVKIYSKNKKEYMEVYLNKIYCLHVQKIDDSEKLILSGSEKDMAEMLFNNPELVEEGFKPLSREEHTKYGFIDLFGYDSSKNLVVVECKRYSGDLKAVSQLRRYVEKIKEAKGLRKVRGVLACPNISLNAKKMLEDLEFKFVKVNPPKYLENFSKKQKKIGEF